MLLQQHFPRLTLLFTDGLDCKGSGSSLSPPNIPDRRGSGSSLPPPAMSANLIETLSQYQGSIALLSGETSFHSGIVPELLISLPPNDSPFAPPTVQLDTLLVPGARVRVYGSLQQGITGTIDYLFAYEQKFPSGLRTRAARLRLADGSFLVVPLMSLERIG